MYTTVSNNAASTVRMEREPVKLIKRIGSTTYTVNVRFNDKSTETIEDKILRLIEGEVRRSA